MDSSNWLEPDIIDREPRKHAWIVGAVIAVTLVTTAAVATFVAVDMGLVMLDKAIPVSREVVANSKSPDGEWLVRVEYVNAGAAASASYQVFAKSVETGDDRPLLSVTDDQLVGEDDTIRWTGSRSFVFAGRAFDID